MESLDREIRMRKLARMRRVARRKRLQAVLPALCTVVLMLLAAGVYTLLDDTKTVQAGINDCMTAQSELILTVDEIKEAVAPEWYYPLSEYEIALVAQVVLAEAGNQDYEGKMAIAQVIRDRAIAWHMEVIDVIYQEGQFANPAPGDPDTESYDAVREVFREGESVLEYPTTHFCKSNMTPYWAEGKVVRGIIGDHTFYY